MAVSPPMWFSELLPGAQRAQVVPDLHWSPKAWGCARPIGGSLLGQRALVAGSSAGGSPVMAVAQMSS